MLVRFLSLFVCFCFCFCFIIIINSLCDLYVNRADLRIGVDDDDADVDDDDYGYGRRGPMDQEALFTKFQAFLTRASSCQSIFSASPAAQQPTPSSSQSQSQSTPTKPPKHPLSSNTPTPKRHVILLEDLPNILHPHTQSQFHAALQGLVDSPVVSGVPVVIIVSDAGVRGEVGDERIAGGGGGRWGKEVVDIRSVLPAGLLGSAYVTQIGYVYKYFSDNYKRAILTHRIQVQPNRTNPTP